MERNQPSPELKKPPKVVQHLFGLLATGRYAGEWVSEFVALYSQIASESGDEAANDWALKELFASLSPSIAARLLHLFRLGRAVWRYISK